MASFTINFFAPISINYVLNTPLFYKKNEENDDVSRTKSKEQEGVDKEIIVAIDKTYEQAGVDNISQFIKYMNANISAYRDKMGKSGEESKVEAGIETKETEDEKQKQLDWKEWEVDMGLEYPYKIIYSEPIIASTINLEGKQLLSPEDYSPCILDGEEARIFLHANGTAIVNYIARFSGEYGTASNEDKEQEDIAQKIKEIYENIINKFRNEIPVLSERVKEVKYVVTKYIKEHKTWAKFFVEAEWLISELFPWQYVVFHMDKTYKLSEEQKALLLYDNADLKDYSKHKNWEIYLAWKAAIIIPKETHDIFTHEILPHVILPHDYLYEILCSLWMELLLVEKLFTTKAREFLLPVRVKPKKEELEEMRHMRVIAENVLSKARAFCIQYQIEFVRLVEKIYDKWLITDNLTVAIRNRVATIDMIYINIKDASNDQRQKYFSFVAMTFTIFSFLAVVTALVCFFDIQDQLPTSTRWWTLGGAGLFAAGALTWLIRWFMR